MAEAPPRYCTNCGHELRSEDQFCANCGTPVHRAAHVPTPEADVPVPPPPQQGGGTAPPPPQQQAASPAQGRSVGRILLLGCLGVAGLFFLLIIAGVLAAGGGGGGGGGEDVADKPGQQPQQQGGGEQGGGEQEPEQQKPSFSDGTYQVGTDIQPGTYRTREGSRLLLRKTKGFYWRLEQHPGQWQYKRSGCSYN